MAERGLIQSLLSNPSARARMLRNEPDRLKKIYWDYINNKRLEYYTGKESLKKANDHVDPIKKENADRIKSMMDEYNAVRAEYNRSFGGHLGIDQSTPISRMPNTNKATQAKPTPAQQQKSVPMAQQAQTKPAPTQKAQAPVKSVSNPARPIRIGAPISATTIDGSLGGMNVSPYYLSAVHRGQMPYGSPSLPMYNLDSRTIAHNAMIAAKANNMAPQANALPIQSQSAQQPTAQANQAVTTNMPSQAVVPGNPNPPIHVAKTRAKKKRVIKANPVATPSVDISPVQQTAINELSRETLDAIYRGVYQSGIMMDDGHTDWLNSNNLTVGAAQGNVSLDVYNPEDYDKYW